MKKRQKKCSRCKQKFNDIELLQWLEDSGALSPKFCKRCYQFVVLNWSEGMDIKNLTDDEMFNA